MIRLIIAGSRDFNDYSLLEREVDNYLLEVIEKLDIELYEEYLLTVLINEVVSKIPVEIVSGRAKGADQLGELYAENRGLKVKEFRPDWEKYKKSAGYIRNEEMAKYATHCIVFIVNSSKGSTHMANLAEKYKLGLKVIELNYE